MTEEMKEESKEFVGTLKLWCRDRLLIQTTDRMKQILEVQENKDFI